MGWLPIHKQNHTYSASRGDLRKQLRQAARGDIEAFKSVSEEYLDFVTEFLIVTGYHEEERIRSYTRQVFQNLWQSIAYFRRVSDFERGLYIFLKQIPVNVAPFQDPLIQKLVLLNSLQRFLVVARDLEQWSSKNLLLATRISKQELNSPLFEAWKILVSFRKTDIDFATNTYMERVVENMEGPFAHADQQKLCKKVKQNPIVSTFKADCLSLRCELIEMRQNARWNPPIKASFFDELVEDIALIKPLKPEFSERIKNQLSFQCVPH